MPELLEKERAEAEPELTLKRKRIMIYFIEAAEKLIRTEGVDGLSIRKIAAEAGYNSATIYNYFNDLEHLALFGSVCYLREYIVSLSQQLTPDMSSIDVYRTIYQCFNEYAFRSPEIFHHLFFGKCSHKLDSVLYVYYHKLFPSELEGLNEQMQEMLVRGSMQERDKIIIKSMVRDGYVAAEKADYTMELIISLHQSYIYEACLKGDSLDIEGHIKKFRQVFEYTLAAAR